MKPDTEAQLSGGGWAQPWPTERNILNFVFYTLLKVFWLLETQIKWKHGGIQTDEGTEEQSGPGGSVSAEGSRTQFDRIHSRGKLVKQTSVKIH